MTGVATGADSGDNVVLHQHDNYVSSWFVRVHGKARFAGSAGCAIIMLMEY
jgi:hypothetical protein